MTISDESLAEMISGRGTKDDAGKIRCSLYPAESYLAICRVFTYGGAKYSADNWRNGMSWRRMLDAVERHVAAWKSGEELDSESGYHHLAHAGCCIAMLLAWTMLPRYAKHDDRWKEPDGEDTEVGDPPRSPDPRARACGRSTSGDAAPKHRRKLVDLVWLLARPRRA